MSKKEKMKTKNTNDDGLVEESDSFKQNKEEANRTIEQKRQIEDIRTIN
jgi:hypothetical protein